MLKQELQFLMAIPMTKRKEHIYLIALQCAIWVIKIVSEGSKYVHVFENMYFYYDFSIHSDLFNFTLYSLKTFILVIRSEVHVSFRVQTVFSPAVIIKISSRPSNLVGM